MGTRLPLIVGLAASALVFAAGCQQGGTATASPKPSRPATLAERAQRSAQPTSNPVQNAARHATPAPAQTPKPEVTGPSVSAAYANSLQVDAQHLVAANGARVTSCGTPNLAACRSALLQVASAASALQHDLDAHPAPACMTTADTMLRSAITLYLQGAQMGTQGIDEGSSTKLTQSKGMLDQGTTRLLSGSDQLGRATCTVPPPNVAA
jgi:hypothetical protein